MSWEYNNHMVPWGCLFRFHSIPHDMDSFPAPENVPEDHRWIFVPQSLSVDDVCRLFKRTVLLHNVGPFIAPTNFNGVDYNLSDKVTHNVRDTSKGLYTHVVPRHFVFTSAGRLEQKGYPDEGMTVVEAMLYHTLHIHIFGSEYFDIINGGHYCRGSRGGTDGTGDAIPYLRWDMCSYDVCLDWK